MGYGSENEIEVQSMLGSVEVASKNCGSYYKIPRRKFVLKFKASHSGYFRDCFIKITFASWETHIYSYLGAGF